jgi:hypothetical protein
MKKKTDEFKKAVKKETNNSKILGKFIAGSFFLIFSYIFYLIPPQDEFSYLFSFLLGGLGMILIMFSLMDFSIKIDYKKHPEKYNLCKRCKCLIKKDKMFCDNCKDRIRRLNKYEEDKKFIKYYVDVIKQEEKEKHDK